KGRGVLRQEAQGRRGELVREKSKKSLRNRRAKVRD
ncbi:hypothetical protein A2U01_0093925, partial [Trifolium medium]|nr:hypothetical protein [Trifolium medium]